MTDTLTIEQIVSDMQQYFDQIELPNPINYPTSFRYYLNIYKYHLDNEEET